MAYYFKVISGENIKAPGEGGLRMEARYECPGRKRSSAGTTAPGRLSCRQVQALETGWEDSDVRLYSYCWSFLLLPSHASF